VKPAVAGAIAALAWAAVEPLDRRLLGNDYSDVAMLGKLATRSSAWPIAGLALHAANGAAFGVAWHRLQRRARVSPLQLALLESTVLFPLTYVVDRAHPARGTRGVARSFTARGFVQETARHALFGAVLGRLARR
jgi:hypothetical protein